MVNSLVSKRTSSRVSSSEAEVRHGLYQGVYFGSWQILAFDVYIESNSPFHLDINHRSTSIAAIWLRLDELRALGTGVH